MKASEFVGKTALNQAHQYIDISSCLRKTNDGLLIALGELELHPDTKKICFRFSPNGKDCIDLREFPSQDI